MRWETLCPVLLGMLTGGLAAQACGSPPNPCSEASLAARVSATVAAVELLADDACNDDRASCPVAQAGLRKLGAIDASCAGLGEGGASQ